MKERRKSVPSLRENRIAWDETIPEEMVNDGVPFKKQIIELKNNSMEKTLSYEDQVKIKNYLTKIKSNMNAILQSKHVVYEIIDNIQEILNKK